MAFGWISWVVFGLIAISVGYELFMGISRLRGFGVYRRAHAPSAYWRSIAFKIVLALLFASLGLFSQISKTAR